MSLPMSPSIYRGCISLCFSCPANLLAQTNHCIWLLAKSEKETYLSARFCFLRYSLPQREHSPPIMTRRERRYHARRKNRSPLNQSLPRKEASIRTIPLSSSVPSFATGANTIPLGNFLRGQDPLEETPTPKTLHHEINQVDVVIAVNQEASSSSFKFLAH